MAREIKGSGHDQPTNGKGGDGNLEDSLDHASEQTAKLNDIALSKLFIETNDKAREKNSTPITELFHEEKKFQEIEPHTPDPQLLQEIYDSLANKDVHHKKLLEEGAPTNIILRFIHYLKGLTNIQVQTQDTTFITPTN